MKLLFDENLSRKLVARLSDLLPGSSHAVFEGLLRSPDLAMWEHAKAHDFTIVTADADFYDLASWLRLSVCHRRKADPKLRRPNRGILPGTKNRAC